MRLFYPRFCHILRCSLLFAVLVPSLPAAWAHSYYVSASIGNDSNNGLSPLAPISTLYKVNALGLVAGDSVLFQRGGVYRGQLLPHSGNVVQHLYYGAYDKGADPLLLGSVDVSDSSGWHEASANIWQSSQASSVDVGNLIFNNEASCGFKQWTLADLTQQGQFYYDQGATESVFLYSVINPSGYYQHIEAAIGSFIVYCPQDSFIDIQHLAFKYGGADGIEIRNSHHIHIYDCELAYIGGTQLNPKQRYGGGIQFWASCHDNTVERCKIHDIYDDAVTNQGNATAGTVVQQYNLFYQDNIIYNCSESSFCYFIQPAIANGSMMKNIYFQNNTCVNAGGGWAAAQRPDLKGFQIYCSSNTAPLDSVFIRDNIFYKSRAVLFFDNSGNNILAGTHLDYNDWYVGNAADTLVAIYSKSALTVYTDQQFKTYQDSTAQDAHSILANPLMDSLTFQLQAASPCLGRGEVTQDSTDYWLQARPQSGNWDIGAMQYSNPINTSIHLAENNRQLQVFPNPNAGIVHIQIENTDAASFFLYDEAGTLRYTSPVSNTALPSFSLPTAIENGLYLLLIKNGAEQCHQKLVVLR